MQCSECQNALPAKIGRGRKRITCSRRCRDVRRLRQLKAMRQVLKQCQICQEQFVCSNERRKRCSVNCKQIAQRLQSKKQSAKKFAKKYPLGYAEHVCGWCGQVRRYNPRTQNPKGFHPDCTIEARQASYRIKTVKRQKIISQARITVKQVVERWGSDCHICRESIDTELPRTSRFGLTLDHVVPLSKGGSDSIENIKPAHWICNVRKSDKVQENA